MKKLTKFAAICFTGAFTLPFVINTTGLNKAEAFSQPPLTKTVVPVSSTDLGSIKVVVPVEEQYRIENSKAAVSLSSTVVGSITVIVPAEEQNRIENSSALISGFAPIDQTSFLKR
ncbi:hypothetical protein [Bacillus sp. AFS031507]|uniref:hypothetical protein n=1 Tax=Bacillus sp. AFS031507 TaxID=2033496 RepID=UPI000BFB767F|nr:hypothetical protein [Bacillus sp. AFS031507]PGY06407.1 hypothetical protein COE25_27675 [Bacillus sp. AFS031507]